MCLKQEGNRCEGIGEHQESCSRGWSTVKNQRGVVQYNFQSPCIHDMLADRIDFELRDTLTIFHSIDVA
jgi:hypothetical protein